MKVKKYINSILEKFISLPIFVIKRIKKRPENFYLNAACKYSENVFYDTAFRLIPKKSESYFKSNVRMNCDPFAIIMQGPIRRQDDFTLETVKFYKKYYPEATVVISTWNDENVDVIKKLENNGAIVILCNKPKSGGHLNINYQLKSSYEGIKYAKDKGFKYVAKTRTDQRISKKNVFYTLISMIQKFPTYDKRVQNSRIVSLSMNYGNMFYPYFMSDFFYMGTCDDMTNLFDGILDSRIPFNMPKDSSKRQYAILEYAPEVYIMKRYLKKLGCTGDCTLKDYWDGIKKYLICIDMKFLDLYWPKYEGKYNLHTFYGDFFDVDDSQDNAKTDNFDFVNWFNLFSELLVYKFEYEKYADIIFK